MSPHGAQTMTSREVVQIINSLRPEGKAELRHDTFVAKLLKLREELNLQNILGVEYLDKKGEKRPEYLLDKEACMIMVASETPKVLQAIIRRWQDLERQQLLQFPNFNNPAEAARAWANEYEQKLLAQNNEKQLQIKLDESKEWLSIKRVASYNHMHWRELSWRKLKSSPPSIVHKPKKIFDANYGEVNVYHIDAWEEIYPELELPLD
jgi:phage regulator Rha-like protein